MFSEKNKKKILFQKNSFAGAQMPGSREIPGAHKKRQGPATKLAHPLFCSGDQGFAHFIQTCAARGP